MDCSEGESVCSVKKENKLGYYRIHTIWKTNGFRINIASRDGAWTGEMTPENVQSISDELKMDPKKYLAECKDVLTTDDGKKDYFYAVENGSFIWKKMIDEESGMKIRMGSVLVQPVSFVDTIQNIIEVALNCKKNLNKELNSLKVEKELNQQRIWQLQKKLEELCEKKNVMEIDLYNKFLLLLNSKKRKIQELEVLLLTAKEGKEKTDKLIHRKSGKAKKMEEKCIAEAYEMDTEDEEDSCGSKNQARTTCTIKNNVTNSSVVVKNNCSAEEQLEQDLSGCEIAVHQECENSCKVTSDLDSPSAYESGSRLGSSNANIKDGSKQMKNSSTKTFPATKDDILDFFFGPS